MTTHSDARRAYRSSKRFLALGFLALALGCSDSGTSSSSEGSGGMGATTGGESSGGATTGGTGTSGTGGAGVTTSGGATVSGGNGPSSGGSATGGHTTGGGAGASTGGSATGGHSTGGVSTGGVGGGSGGASTGGVAPTTGGTSSGGAPAGGTSSGGAATGGTSIGGVATGGAATGGTDATGGQSAGYCPEDEPCRISPLGDSITEGFTVDGGYRIELFSLAVEAGQDITFVGTRSNGPDQVANKPFPKAHEGTSGITIEGLKQVVDGGALTRDDVKPHIILLHIGTNNMYNTHPAPPEELLPPLLDKIISDCPDALLVVAQIIPYNGVESYNAKIPDIVEERRLAGKHIMLVDQYTDFPSEELQDGVHPSAQGYARMANVWYEAIKQYLH